MTAPSASFSSCPQCGAPLPSAAPEGLCPRCLAAGSLQGETVLTGAADAPAATPSVEEIAPHFPQLEILECLGRGGMGVVFRARQKALGRVVALKLLAPERVHEARFARHFVREAQALAALSHPGIVTVHDFGEAGGFFYLLMEYVEGVNLRQAMQAGRFTPEQAMALVPRVCEALQYAHEHGIVHRDIKPENLLLDKAGRVKIADFGIAKMLSEEEADDCGLAESQPAGTPQYMAPEQAVHRQADHRADIYSLGVVLYELLTGELPDARLQPPSGKVQLDVRLDAIVLRALERTPELRYQTAGEFRTQLETIAAPPPARRRHLRGWAAVLLSVCLLAGARSAWLLSRHPTLPTLHVRPMHPGPPFLAQLRQGSVEILALRRPPDEGGQSWLADGSPAPLFIQESGRNSAAGKKIVEIAVQVQRRGEALPSFPRLRFPAGSGFSGMGSSSRWDTAAKTSLTQVQAIACPPEALEIDLEIGVAEGDWETVTDLHKPSRESPFAGEESSNAEGTWDAHLEYTEVEGNVALAFHYSAKEEWETRMAFRRANGRVDELLGNGSQSAAGLRHSLRTFSAADYGQIERFLLQRRRCHWAEFRHVSLQPGHHTEVEIADGL